MLLSALAFLAGGCLLLLYPALPGIPLWIPAGAMLLCLWPSRLLRGVACLLLGLWWSAWHADTLLAQVLPEALQGHDALVRGVVRSLPEQPRPGQARFHFDIAEFRVEGVWQPLAVPVRLNWYRDAARLRPGDRWQLRVRLKKPHGFSNPGGFDYERWLFSRGVRATGYVKPSVANHRLLGSEDAVGLVRQRLVKHLDQLVLPGDTTALLKALAVGDRSGLDKQHWQVLQATGTSHLLAISGLHVGLVSTLVFALVKRLAGLSGLARWYAAPRLAAVAAMIAALGYALLAGFELPARRACIMIWVWMSAILLNGRPCGWRVLGIALWLVLLSEPLAAFSAGFWLSFVAVTLIIYLNQGRQGQSGKMMKLFSLQAGITLGLTPLLWFWFQQSSWLAFPANLVAIPWLGLLVVPVLLAAVGLLGLAQPVSDGLFQLAAYLLLPLWQGLDSVSGLPGIFMPAPAAGWGWCLPVGIALAILLFPRALRMVPLAVLLALPAFWVRPDRPLQGDLWLRLLDVGQGLSVVIETRSRVLVYDAGPAYPSGFDTGAAVVAPYLTQRGYRHIDRLVISHGDNDHRGGVESLLGRLPAGQIDAGDPGATPGLGAEQCLAGRSWHWDGVRFEYLWPRQPGRGNNGSCVLRITTGDGRSVLLAGDIEKSAEMQLTRGHQTNLGAQVLVAPHHGSTTSSIQPFATRVRPELVLFATGYRNRFGFPKAEVVSRYRQLGSRTLDTARSGAIEVRLERNQSLLVRPWRRVQRRFWSR